MKPTWSARQIQFLSRHSATTMSSFKLDRSCIAGCVRVCVYGGRSAYASPAPSPSPSLVIIVEPSAWGGCHGGSWTSPVVEGSGSTTEGQTEHGALGRASATWGAFFSFHSSSEAFVLCSQRPAHDPRCPDARPRYHYAQGGYTPRASVRGLVPKRAASRRKMQRQRRGSACGPLTPPARTSPPSGQQVATAGGNHAVTEVEDRHEPHKDGFGVIV